MPALRRDLALLVFAIMALTAPRADAAQIDDCIRPIGRAAIAPCTLVIDDQKENPGNRAVAYLMRGRAELDVSEIEKAEADINAGLALRPNNPFGHRLHGRLRGLQGRNEEARADYNKGLALAETPNSKFFSYVDRGQFLTRIKEYADALADFDAAIHIDGAKAIAYVGRAVAYKGMGRIEEALASLDWAATVEPAYWVTYIERGDILLAQKNYSEAAAAYGLALEQRPGDVRAQRGRAAALAAGGTADAPKKPEEPSQVASPAAPPAPPQAAPPPPASAPNTGTPPVPAPAPAAPTTPAAEPAGNRPPGPPASQSVDAPDPMGQDAEVRRKKLQSALQLRQNRKFDDALAVYDAMLKAVPTDVEVAIEKGRTLMQMTRWKDALDTFKAVIDGKSTADNAKAIALTNQSEILAVNNQFDGAIKTASDALQINPKLPVALYWRGFSQYGVGAFAPALADFQQASALAPKAWTFPAWEALALIAAGDTDKAKDAIGRSLAAQADNVDGLLARARLNLVAGDIAAADADFAQVTRRGAATPIVVQTQQLIMLHKIMKATDPPAKATPR
jgi:tetratricopeptide (TPR) repeat protein